MTLRQLISLRLPILYRTSSYKHLSHITALKVKILVLLKLFLWRTARIANNMGPLLHLRTIQNNGYSLPTISIFLQVFTPIFWVHYYFSCWSRLCCYFCYDRTWRRSCRTGWLKWQDKTKSDRADSYCSHNQFAGHSLCKSELPQTESVQEKEKKIRLP